MEGFQRRNAITSTTKTGLHCTHILTTERHLYFCAGLNGVAVQLR